MDASRICRRCMQNLATARRYYSMHNGPRDYKAAVAALNTLQSNFSIVEAIRQQGPGWNKLAIPEMIKWVRRIGYEPSDFDKLNPIHIAGTKGKGSTSTFISYILAQYLPTQHSIPAERVPSNVGLYTSPHLRFVRERIQINNHPVSEELFAECFWELWDRLESTSDASAHSDQRNIGGKPVYFHYLTLLAFHCYLREKLGTAVIECGIGGEYDTTNVLTKPSVTGVTTLGLDHEALLGDTIESIAWHKAGIFKENVPAFSAPQSSSAEEVLRDRAKERRAPLKFVTTHPALDRGTIKLGLQGEFQKTNASLAVAIAAQHLKNLGFNGIPDPLGPEATLPDEFITGLESARLGGRCEMRTDSKLPSLTWYIDGGHTLASIEVAGQWFATASSTASASDCTRVLIFNQQTRDAPGLARRLFETLAFALNDNRPFKHAIFCPNVTYRDSGYKADLVSLNTNKHDISSLKVQNELAKTWDEIDHDASVHVVGTIEEAIAKARELGGDQKTEVLVTGSLHLVGGLIDILESETDDLSHQN